MGRWDRHEEARRGCSQCADGGSHMGSMYNFVFGFSPFCFPIFRLPFQNILAEYFSIFPQLNWSLLVTELRRWQSWWPLSMTLSLSTNSSKTTSPLSQPTSTSRAATLSPSTKSKTTESTLYRVFLDSSLGCFSSSRRFCFRCPSF